MQKVKYFERFGVSEQAKKKEEYFSGKYDDVKIPSSIDKFKARMDRFKKLVVKDYNIWEIDCKYIGSRKCKRWLKKRLRKVARARLKEEGNND